MTKYSFVEYKIVSEGFDVEAESLEKAKKILYDTTDRYCDARIDVGDEAIEGFSGDIPGDNYTDYVYWRGEDGQLHEEDC